MQELEATKAKRVTIPKRCKRYAVAYFSSAMGWQNSGLFHTTPESALEEFLRIYSWKDDDDSFYTVYEIYLEIPIIKR